MITGLSEEFEDVIISGGAMPGDLNVLAMATMWSEESGKIVYNGNWR